jgi:hypothetical protein
MDGLTGPASHDPVPTSSNDPRQQNRPDAPSIGTMKDMTAHDTVPTGTDGIEGTRSRVTDGPKNPDPSSGHGHSGTGTEYNTHMKGTAAPGSHSELFGLSPGDEEVHAPAEPRSGPGSGIIGTTGHKGTHNTSTSAGLGSTGALGSEGGGKPGLSDRLNPMMDADGDGKSGFSD